jgi:hypothetical protein
MKTSSSEPTQRLNVDLPKSQYFALKSYALHNDTTVSQLVRDRLQEIVDYDVWFKARVQASLDALNNGTDQIIPAEAWQKKRAEMQTQLKALRAKA